MKTCDFEYELPAELIASRPAARRSASRLMVLRRKVETLEHRSFADLPEYVVPGEVLVINDTRVFPARLRGTFPKSGAGFEVLLVRKLEDGCWKALVRPGRRLKPGRTLELAGGELVIRIEAFGDSAGERVVSLEAADEKDPMQVVERLGHVPLPPYIERPDCPADRERYQTVYAKNIGAVAAPTAGLHFTPELMKAVRSAGGTFEQVTLHVGPGTFRPVRAERVEDHRMESEYYEVEADALERILEAKGQGRLITAVGTTSVRTLETVACRLGCEGTPEPGTLAGDTGLFIYPGFEFRLTGRLLTNFHLPRSSLLMLVCAFAGTEFIRHAYSEAVRLGYRFYSYGDAMLII
ncbi:MAG: tRNA preQ1(34) S-adenosylmethionine ribosyltransferase-isomerase QueA [Gemmatimonadota bacterium]|nr:tRNA preQ1(34) S-adenosylmethionine ribosyltransferase-isomerase QueA [Gemmatimonadota bacterium]